MQVRSWRPSFVFFFCYNNKKKLGKTRSGESGVRRRVGESLAFCLFVCLFRSRRRRRRLAKKKLGRKNPVRSGSRGRTLEEEEKRWQNKRIVNPNWVNEVQRHAKKNTMQNQREKKWVESQKKQQRRYRSVEAGGQVLFEQVAKLLRAAGFDAQLRLEVRDDAVLGLGLVALQRRPMQREVGQNSVVR